METIDFAKAFAALTGNPPFPWQQELHQRFLRGRIPASCNVPTGLGKTAVIPMWLIALANSGNGQSIPRRLVYVVNRRTVVDQATEEAKRLRERLLADDRSLVLKQLLKQLAEMLAGLASTPANGPLAISTLRGQFADNREWSADPSQPAVIVGTVDMIGSRLLFSGYGAGFKLKPLHAGFLGQDVLLVHDEAHLEPAFQKLIEDIRDEQKREPAPLGEQLRLKVMALTATPRGTETPFELNDEEKAPPEKLPAKLTEPIHYVWQRLQSKKGIAFHHPEGDKEKVADRIGKLAKQYAKSHPGSAILVFVSSLDDHITVCKALKDEQVQVLTGTLRGLERDRMADPRKETGCPIFARFLKPPKPDDGEKDQWKVTPTPGTVYLVCTSAGEVGIDISADHMVCDLAAFERMAQRFGRVNRFGTGDANIDVVHEATRDKKKESDPNDQARWKTLELLKELPFVGERRTANPLALMRLRGREDLKSNFDSAYTPQPTILPVSDILFDAWALTTIRGKLPGRPRVEPYLHGMTHRDPPETYVAWREEVWELDPRREPKNGPIFRDARQRHEFEKYAEDLLEDYPIKPHELLRDSTFRKNTGVQATLARLAEGHGHLPVWIQDFDGSVNVMTLADVAEAELANSTVILPPQAGGLSRGILTADPYIPEKKDYDVADEWRDEKGNQRRVRVWDNDPQFDEKTKGMRLIRPPIDVDETEDEESTGRRFWKWYVRPRSSDDDGSRSALTEQTLGDHVCLVEKHAKQFVTALDIVATAEGQALILAAKWHDLGKDRQVWQQSIRNAEYPQKVLAKSGNNKPPRDLTSYRHEFGSLLDVVSKAEFQQLSEDMKDLVLHLIAVHHGRGRPHFPPDEAFDSEPKGNKVMDIAAAVPRRFAKLQRKYGRWGLAYLESLLRAADYAASAAPSAFVEDKS
jgi:CRISPR-associated endonuclease/helicase Cas3